ncbi:DUF4388 domain-containing protein [Thermosynechococcus sp.]|uniref:DUF4388 domain-containing protein n=1 Tax=Thermosynechococcus sp. TaxID=2814275 RepID=UPI00391C245E
MSSVNLSSIAKETTLRAFRYKLYPLNQPLGLLLKSQGALDSQQLQLLFKQQVPTPIPELSSLTEGWFKFDANHPLLLEEMTGLSAPPRDVALVGLRLLQDWTALMDKLPLPDSTIVLDNVSLFIGIALSLFVVCHSLSKGL